MGTDPAAPVVRVSAALIRDEDGRCLLVRKRATAVFMQPGGKPHPGESPALALCRELEEELGVTTQPDDLVSVGSFSAAAANEPGHTVVADVFALDVTPGWAARAEIAEAVWVDPDDPGGRPLAPLLLHVLASLA